MIRHHQYRKNLFNLVVIVGLITIFQSISVSGQESVSFQLTDRAGTGFGKYIEGSFTLKAEGSSNIIRLSVLFNGNEVQNTTGKSISWRFNTNDYATGTLNITVIGWNNLDQPVQSTKEFEILPGWSTPISVALAIGLAVIVSIYRRMKPRVNAPITKSQVRLDNKKF